MKDVRKFKRNMRISMVVFIALFSILIIYLCYSLIAYGAKWYATPYNPRVQNINQVEHAGPILDRNGTPLAWSEGKTRKYHADKTLRRAVSHAVGDIYGQSLGAETIFSKYIYGSNKGLITRVLDLLNRRPDTGGDVTLTIDAKISKYIYQQMDGRTGAVVLMNYKTGEVIANVNIPTFDPTTLKDNTPEDTSLVNRGTMGQYPPGSLMKLVTASAALEDGVDFTWECTGVTTIGGARVACANENVHGKLDLKKALIKSCNIYFGELAVKLGADRLTQQAEKMGFNTEFLFEEVNLKSSTIDAYGEKGDLAWTGIGQHKDLVTPMHMAMLAGAIANGGTMMEPKMLKSVSYGGMVTQSLVPMVYRQVLSGKDAGTLKSIMAEVVNSGTGKNAAIRGTQVYGKTGTADFMEDGVKKNHSWFIGFIDEEDSPYAIAVVFEGAGLGSANAAPVAGKILKYAMG